MKIVYCKLYINPISWYFMVFHISWCLMCIVAAPARYNPSRGYWGSSSGFVQESQAAAIVHRELMRFDLLRQVLLLFRDSGLVPKSQKLCQFHWCHRVQQLLCFHWVKFIKTQAGAQWPIQSQVKPKWFRWNQCCNTICATALASPAPARTIYTNSLGFSIKDHINAQSVTFPHTDSISMSQNDARSWWHNLIPGFLESCAPSLAKQLNSTTQGLRNFHPVSCC